MTAVIAAEAADTTACTAAAAADATAFVAAYQHAQAVRDIARALGRAVKVDRNTFRVESAAYGTQAPVS